MFADQLAPNSLINAALRRLSAYPTSFESVLARLDDLCGLPFGRPLTARPQYQVVRRLLEPGVRLSTRDFSVAKRALLSFNALSSIVTRTRRVDVPDAKAARVAETINGSWTKPELDFYQAVIRRYHDRLDHTVGAESTRFLRVANVVVVSGPAGSSDSSSNSRHACR